MDGKKYSQSGQPTVCHKVINNSKNLYKMGCIIQKRVQKSEETRISVRLRAWHRAVSPYPEHDFPVSQVEVSQGGWSPFPTSQLCDSQLYLLNSQYYRLCQVVLSILVTMTLLGAYALGSFGVRFSCRCVVCALAWLMFLDGSQGFLSLWVVLASWPHCLKTWFILPALIL